MPVPPAGGAVAGAVLAGGASRRMGRDKATLVVDGVPMVVRVAEALRGAGCSRVLAIGGETSALSSLGLDVVADRFPGEGPLGGVITALAATSTTTLVMACDLPRLDAATAVALVAAMGRPTTPPTDVVAARTDRRQPLAAVWHPRALAHLERVFAAGERSVLRALDGLIVVDVEVSSRAAADVDTPADLARLDEHAVTEVAPDLPGPDRDAGGGG